MRGLPPFLSRSLATQVEAEDIASGPWAQAWAQPAFRYSWLLLLVVLFGVIVPSLAAYFRFIQQRPGLALPDPLLAMLPRHNVAVPVFVLMYGAVLAAVGWLTRHPALLLRGLWGYCLLLLLRMLTIWLLPLEPPVGLLPMPDPFTAQVFQTASSEAITKDLFFSGHTATVVLLALAVRGYWWRRALALVALLIGVLVLVQRVHYTYDVLAAPCFTWLAYWLAGRLTSRATEGSLPTA